MAPIMLRGGSVAPERLRNTDVDHGSQTVVRVPPVVRQSLLSDTRA
jgi:hypothetical protein